MNHPPVANWPVRILVVTNTLRGGTGAHLVRLLEHLPPEKWEVKLICQGSRDFDPPPHVTLLDHSGRLGPLHRFPIAQWRQFQRVRDEVRSFRPHVIHSFFFWPIIYARLLKKLGYQRHIVENREDQGFAWSNTDYRLLRATAAVPDRVICVSAAVESVLTQRENPPPSVTKVIRNGVAVPSLDTHAKLRRAVRDELGLAEDDLVVAMVANLDHEVKGARYFIEAMPLVARANDRARFLVLGEGRTRGELTRRADELGVGDRVLFTGFRSDMHRIYPAIDVSALTSLSEGLSITVLESMSWALPVVATDVGGNPELIQHGQTGFLVPPRDPPAFAERVTELLGNESLRLEFGRRGRAVVEAHFALEEVAARYEDTYRDVTGTGGWR